jgi:hypothetical protein
MIPSFSPDLDLLDESLNENRAPDCALTVQVSNEHLAFAVLDLQHSRYLAAQTYSYPYHFNPDDYSLWLQEIATSGIASWHYHRIGLFIANLEYTLIPGPLFDPSQKEDYLKFNLRCQDNVRTRVDRLNGLDAHTVFTVPRWLDDKLAEIYPGVTPHHTISCLLESVLSQYKFLIRNHTAFINLQPGYFDLIILHEQKVTFCNSFYFKSPDDVLYYIMFILEQMRLSPGSVELSMAGEIGRHARVVEKVSAYLPHLDFLPRNESFRYSHVFEEIPGHYLYTLLSAAGCEL